MQRKPNAQPGFPERKRWGENPPTKQNPYGINRYKQDTRFKGRAGNPDAVRTDATRAAMQQVKRKYTGGRP